MSQGAVCDVERACSREAFLLVGGRGRRLGAQPKGLIEHRGEPLICAVARAVAPLSSRLTLLSASEDELKRHGRGAERERYLNALQPLEREGLISHVRWCLEPTQQVRGGALRALCAALALSESPWIWALACDLPLLSERVLSPLAELTTTQEQTLIASLYEHEGHLQPLCGLWSRRALPLVQSMLREGRPLSSLKAHPLVRVRSLKQGSRALLNLNTPQDVTRLKALGDPSSPRPPPRSPR
jgi:molybdopterin-guanine dinucleotide biosynthesis protein A